MDDDMILDSLWWLNLYGLDPTKYSEKGRAWTYVCLTSLSISTGLVLMSLFQVEDLDGVIEVFDSFYPFVQSILKISVIAYNRKRILKILSILRRLQSVQDIRFDPKFRTKYYLAKRFMIILRNVYNSAVVLMVGKALYLGNGTFPIRVWEPKDLNAVLFAIYFVVMCANGFLLIIVVGAFDSFYVSIITHIVGQIRYFNDCLRVVFEEDNMEELVDRHNLIFDCISYIEEVFGLQLLYQLLSNTANICLGLVIIKVYGFLNINGIIHMVMVFSSLSQLFVFCFFGYQVAIQLDDTSFAIYESTWWKYPKSAKDILYMITRSNKINPLTIGGVAKLDLETYTEVVKKSFSFYALLNAQREEG